MISQIRTRDAFIPNEIRMKWLQNGFNPEVLQNAFNEQPVFEKESLENMLNLFSMLCDFIVSKGYIRSRRLDIASEALRWMEKRISGPFLFPDLAKHLGYSQNTVLNALKKRLNMTFRQLRVLKKIEAFERIVLENPGVSVEDAALKAGYNDASYFSRVYKKVRSTTPSAFIKSVGQGSEVR